MATNETTIEISDGAVELLRVARENDSHKVITSNAALLAVLELGGTLVRTTQSRAKKPLFLRLDEDDAPKNFLELVVACLRRVRKELDEQYGTPEKKATYTGRPLISDFDTHAFHAFAEALADSAWPERAAKDFDGPSLKVCRTRLSQIAPEQLWEHIIQHYLANIMQYYFAAARLREKVPDMDAETEINLRRNDARALAMRVTAVADKSLTKGEPTSLLTAMRTVLDAVTGDKA